MLNKNADAPSWQYEVSVWMPFVTGHLSVFGSGWIIWHVFCQAGKASGSTARQYRNHSAVLQTTKHTYRAAHVRQKLQQKPHLRILLALSIYDLLGSGAFAWTFAFSPKGKSGYDGAFGNMNSCQTQGFLIQVSTAVAIYSGLLSLYYYLTICQGIRLETWWAWEKAVHVVTFIIVMGLAIAGVATDMFHPIYAYCYIAPNPSTCGNDMKNPCETWFTPDDMGWILQVWGHWMNQIAIVVVFASNYMIWQKVRRQSNRMTRYHVKKTTATSTSIHNSSNHNSITSSIHNASMHSTNSVRSSVLAQMSLSRRFRQSSRDNVEQSKRSNRETLVFQQCFFLTLAFILCAMGPTTFHLTMWTRGYLEFWQTFLIVLLGPLHGFMNFLVFSRPIYLGVRKRYAGKLTAWQVLRAVYFRRDPYATAAQWAEQHSLTCSSSANHCNNGINNGNNTISAESSGNMISTLQHTSKNPTSREELTAQDIVETTAVDTEDEPGETRHHDNGNIKKQEYLENDDDDDISDAMSLGDLNQYDDKQDIAAAQVAIETTHGGVAYPLTVEEVAGGEEEEEEEQESPHSNKPLETVCSEGLPLDDDEEDV